MKCPMCGRVKPVRPNSVFTGRSKSCGCYQRQRASQCRRLPIDEVRKRFVAKGFPPPTNYQGNDKPVDTICPRCGTPFKAIPWCIFSGHTKSCGCLNREQLGERRREDITGMRNGRLLAVKPTEARRHDKVVWECMCDCGRTVLRTVSQFKAYKSCGCLLKRTGRESPLWKGFGGISGAFWAGIRVSARKRKIPMKISIEECWELFLKQNQKCDLSGVQLRFGIRQKDETTASLDRIDSRGRKPYILGNVQWVHKTVNKLKQNLDQERFKYLCELVATPISSEEAAPSCLVGKKHGNFKGCGNIGLSYWHNLQNAECAGRKFVLPDELIETAWQIFVEQCGRCALTGLPLDFDKFIGSKKRHKYYLGSASIDRIDSSKGYSAHNIQWVHKDINRMKGDVEETDLRKWCKLIANYLT